MSWRPLITDFALREAVLSMVRDIASAVNQTSTDGAPVALHCDRALMLVYLAADDAVHADGASISAHVGAALEAQREHAARKGLHDGVAHMGWTIAHLAGDDDEDEMCAAIDESLAGALENGWDGSYDLVRGLVGFGVYALERRERGKPLASRVLQLLGESAQRRGSGVGWHTRSDLLPAWQRVNAPSGRWDLGLAHGVAGIIGFCARCIAKGIGDVDARALMNDAVTHLVETYPASETGRFPSWERSDGSSPLGRASLAWCYGDLGLASALCAAANVEPRWTADAVMLARACATRASSVRDTGICHGAAGAAHVLNRLYQVTADEVVGEGARRWLHMLLSMRNDRDVAGFPSYDAVAGWRADSSLLTGAAGVALVLHAMVSDVEPLWDRLLLLDV